VGLWDREGRVPHRIFWAVGMEKPTYVCLGGLLTKEVGRTACAPQPSRCATSMDAPLLSGYIGE